MSNNMPGIFTCCAATIFTQERSCERTRTGNAPANLAIDQGHALSVDMLGFRLQGPGLYLISPLYPMAYGGESAVVVEIEGTHTVVPRHATTFL